MKLIVGYGNPLCSDDGIGHYLAQSIEKLIGQSVSHDWMVITSTQLTPELAEPISLAERVVFIDARIGDTPGQITCEQPDVLVNTSAFVHFSSPASILALTAQLHGSVPPALVIGVTGASFDYGTELSPALAAQFPDLLRQVREQIATFAAD